MSAPVSLRYFARAVVVHPTEPCILLQNQQLPAAEHHQSLYMGDHVTTLFASLGPLVFLQRMKLRREQKGEREWDVHYVFALGALNEEAPEGHSWVNVSDLPDDLIPLAERALNPSPSIPWQDRQWLSEALAWTDRVLEPQGIRRTGAEVLIKSWQISVLYRIPTTAGWVYLKAVPRFFDREGGLTSFLHDLHPQAAPTVLAHDPENRMFLMASAGDRPAGAEQAFQAMRLLATVQRRAEGQLPRLKALGCLERGPEVLKDHMRQLFADQQAMEMQGQDQLSEEDRTTLLASLQHLEQVLDDLRDSPIPLSIVHGDLHLGNVVCTDQHLTVLDWSDGAIGHPFLDANSHCLLEEEDPALHQALTDAYLQAWTDLMPLEDLRELHRKAMLAGELHRAASYHQYIVPGVPDQTEWEDAHLEHLQNLLEALREPAPAAGPTGQ